MRIPHLRETPSGREVGPLTARARARAGARPRRPPARAASRASADALAHEPEQQVDARPACGLPGLAGELLAPTSTARTSRAVRNALGHADRRRRAIEQAPEHGASVTPRPASAAATARPRRSSASSRCSQPTHGCPSAAASSSALANAPGARRSGRAGVGSGSCAEHREGAAAARGRARRRAARARARRRRRRRARSPSSRWPRVDPR